MTREPLMLSDTAMMLLQDYIELKHQVKSTSTALRQGLTISRSSSNNSDTILSNSVFEATGSLPLQISEVQTELLQDIWALWIFPDVRPIRHLEWHVVFDERLMEVAERRFVSRPAQRGEGFQGIAMSRVHSDFMSQLAAAYQAALDVRNIPSDKDHS